MKNSARFTVIALITLATLLSVGCKAKQEVAPTIVQPMPAAENSLSGLLGKYGFPTDVSSVVITDSKSPDFPDGKIKLIDFKGYESDGRGFSITIAYDHPGVAHSVSIATPMRTLLVVHPQGAEATLSISYPLGSAAAKEAQAIMDRSYEPRGAITIPKTDPQSIELIVGPTWHDALTIAGILELEQDKRH
jgi:hypothetical protein